MVSEVTMNTEIMFLGCILCVAVSTFVVITAVSKVEAKLERLTGMAEMAKRTRK